MKAVELVPEVVTIKALNELRDRLFGVLKDNLLKVLFFGSRARGFFGPDSDVDVFILVRKKDKEIIDRVFSIAEEIEENFFLNKISFSIHIYDAQRYLELKRAGSLFIKNIESEGIVIYEGVTGG